MKKALVVLLALAVVASGFAQPVADVNVAEFSGNASVTWGVDLDKDNATGFKNETEAKVVVNIFDAAEQSTEGDGIWAELVIKTDALKIVNKGKAADFDEGDDGIRIDTAKLHFNDLYVGIKADGTKVGEFHLPRALNFKKIMTVPGVGPDRKPGIVAGYDSDLFKVAVDFRSAKAVDAVASKFDLEAYSAAVIAFMFDLPWEDAKGKPRTGDPDEQLSLFYTEAVDGVSQYSNDYAIRAVAKVTPIENLDTYVGFSYAFEKATGAKKNQMGFGANVLYKYELNDTFYLQPGVGYSSTFAEIPVDKTDKGTLGASLLFGFAGDPSDVGVGILDTAKDFYKFAHDETFDDITDITDFFAKANDVDKEYKWVADANAGVSVSTMLDLNEEGDAQVIPLFIDFNLGDALVENLGAVAFVRTADVKNFTDAWALGAGVNYVLNADPAEVTLKAGLLRLSYVPSSDVEWVWTQFEFGAEVGGLINNTTFSASYVSGNLTQSDDAGTTDPTFKNGTINLTCKIAL